MQHKIAFFAAINHNYDHKQQALKNRNHGRTGRGGGGGGGLQPPQNFGQLRFFGQQEKTWAKNVFKDVSMFIELF